jgi:hypothetical protein
MYRVHKELLIAAERSPTAVLPRCDDDPPLRCYSPVKPGVKPARNPTILGPESTHSQEYRGQVKAKGGSAILTVRVVQ